MNLYYNVDYTSCNFWINNFKPGKYYNIISAIPFYSYMHLYHRAFDLIRGKYHIKYVRFLLENHYSFNPKLKINTEIENIFEIKIHNERVKTFLKNISFLCERFTRTNRLHKKSIEYQKNEQLEEAIERLKKEKECSKITLNNFLYRCHYIYKFWGWILYRNFFTIPKVRENFITNIKFFRYYNFIKNKLKNFVYKQKINLLKKRGKIRYSNKKIRKQKGTGRARVGSKASPLFRGGGSVFNKGSLHFLKKINKKERKNLIIHSFCLFNHKIKTISNLTNFNKYNSSKQFEIGIKTLLSNSNIKINKMIFIFPNQEKYIEIYKKMQNLQSNFTKKKIKICIFPKIKIEHLINSDIILLPTDFNKYVII